MKKIALTLLTIFSLFVISCEIGLGASVDTDAPSLEILNPPVDSVIRDTFALSGTWADDGNIASVNVALKRTDISGETKNIAGTLAGDIRLGGSGTWTAEIVPVAEDGTKLISDGSYQATVTIKDTVGRTTIRNTTFTIDNTPPVIVLTRPSTAADSLSSDTYGQTFNLEGQAADTNNVSLIEVMIYSDAECTNHIHTVPLKNVPNSINMDVAKFVKGDTENDYFKIYGESTTEGGPKQFYCKVVAYDGAQRFPADGSAQTEADQKGNGIDTYYLYKDIATTILQNYKITEVYSMLNGTYTASGTARSVSVEDVMTLLNNSKKAQGKFTLNPKNNPTFAVTGRNPLLLNGSDFTGSANNISDGTKVVIEVSTGLDGILLEESSLKVFAVECDLNGKKTGTPIALDFDKEESGTSYRLITKIDKAKGLVIGRNYLFDVQGWDQSESKNNVEPVGLAYGFHMATSGKAPVLELTTPPSSTSYTNESKQVFVGSVSVEDGVPKVIATYNNTEYEITNFTTSANGNETKYSFEWESPDFGDSNGTHQFEFKAVMDTDSQPIERTIVHDIDKPVIGDLKINEAKKYYRDTSNEHYEDGQTYPERYLNATVNASIDITDPYDAIKTATYKIILNDNEAAATEVAMVNPSKFVFTPLDTTQITDGTKVTFKVVASDRAGNTETHSEEFIVDQETNIPFVYPKDHENISLRADAEDQKINVTASSSFALKVYDDDGVGSSKLAVTAKRSGRLTSRNATTTDDNWTTLESPAITIIDDELTIRVPDSGGYYKYKISVRDIANNITYDVPEFVIHAAIAAASVTNVTKNPAYIQNVAGKSFTITVDGLSSQGPYKLFRRIGDTGNFEERTVSQSDFPFEDTLELASANQIAEGTKVYYYVEDSTPRESNKDKNVEINFDDDAPTLTITSPSTNKTGTSALSEPIMFGGSSSDAKSGIAKVYYRFTQNTAADDTSVPYVLIDSSTQPLKSSPFTIDNVEFTSGTTHVNGKLEEGKWYFQAYAEDAAGNISATDVKEFDINLSAPALTVTVNGNTDNCKLSGGAYYFKGDFTGTVNSSDTGGNGKVEFFVGNSDEPVLSWDTINTSNETFTISADKFTESTQQKLTIKATDSFGKVTSETINVYKDTTNPELSVTNPGDQTAAAVTIRGTANDAGVGVEKVQWSTSASGTYADVTTFNHNSPNWSLSVADLGSEGTKEYYFKAVDALNNTTAAESVSFMYDMAAPAITTKLGGEILTSSTTKPSTKTSDKFKFTIVESNGLAESDAVTLSVKQGETSLALNTGYTIKEGTTSISSLNDIVANKEYTIEINSYTDALYSYELSARDKAGKTSGVISRSVRLDTTAPSIEVTSPDFSTYQNSSSINVRGTCEDDSGTFAVWYIVKNSGDTAPVPPTANTKTDSSWTDWTKATGTSSWSASGVSGVEGTIKKLYIAAVDNNGIVTTASNVVVKDIKIDLYNPSFTETGIGEGKSYKNSSYTFSGTASDTGSGIKSITISDGTNTYNWYNSTTLGTTTTGFSYNDSNGEWSYVVSGTEGEHNYTLTATDGADKTNVLSRTVVYDTTLPEIGAVPVSEWYKTRTITLQPSVSDLNAARTANGSGVDTVEASLIAYDSTNPNANRAWVDIPLSNGNYKGTVDFTSDGTDKKIYIRAKDKAGNSSVEKEVTVKIDTSDPDLEKLKYKVGNTSLRDVGGTVYINSSNGITVYGSYSDEQSGVGELTIEGTVADGNGNNPVITYSTEELSETKPTVDTLTYAPYAIGNASSIKYWKAEIANGNIGENSTTRLSVTGTNIAGGTKVLSLFQVTKDTALPTFSNPKVEPNTEAFSVYKTTEGEGASAVDIYYLNNAEQTFTISGLASDNTSVDQVYLKIENVDSEGNRKTGSTDITDHNASGYFSGIQFKEPGTNGAFWADGAKVTITVTDIAGNSTEDTANEIVLNIKFDTQGPQGVHALDGSANGGKDLYFRIGDQNRDEYVLKDPVGDVIYNNAGNATVVTSDAQTTYSGVPAWDAGSNTAASKDKDVGGKYSGTTYGNAETVKIRGKYVDDGSGINLIYYKIYTTQPNSATTANFLENYKNDNDGYFSLLKTTETRRVFYTGDVTEFKGSTSKTFTPENGGTVTKTTASGTETKNYTDITTNYKTTIPNLTAGENYLVFVAVDNVGNAALESVTHNGTTYDNYKLNVDYQAPTIDSDAPATGLYTKKTQNLTITGTVQDNPAGVNSVHAGIRSVWLKYDEDKSNWIKATVNETAGTWSATVRTDTLTSLADTQSYVIFTATATDDAGTGNPSSCNVTVTIDDEEPTVDISLDTSTYKIGGTNTEGITQVNDTIKIKGSASDINGLKEGETLKLYYTTNAAEKDAVTDISRWTEYTATPIDSHNAWTINVTNNDTIFTNNTIYYFTVKATDKAENIGYATPLALEVNKDTDRPVIKLNMTFPAEAANAIVSDNTGIDGTIKDDDGNPAVDKVWCYVSDTDVADVTTITAWKKTGDTGAQISYNATSGSFTIAPGDGTKYVYFKIEDKVGTTFITKATTTYDFNSPKITNKDETVTYGVTAGTATRLKIKTDTEAPLTSSFAYLAKGLDDTKNATSTNANGWSSSTGSAVLGGTTNNTFRVRLYAYDINGIESVTFKIPMSEDDPNDVKENAVQDSVDTSKYYYQYSLSTKTSTTGLDNTITIGTNTYTLYWLEDTAAIDVTGFASGTRSCIIDTFDGTKHTTETYSFSIDNIPAEATFTSHSNNDQIRASFLLKGGFNDGDNKTNLKYITSLSATEPTASAWASATTVNNVGSNSWGINFDGAATEAQATHGSLPKQIVANLTANVIINEAGKAVYENAVTGHAAGDLYTIITTVYFHMLASDGIGNSKWSKIALRIDPQGDIPTITMDYPAIGDEVTTATPTTKAGLHYSKLSGYIRAQGSAEDDKNIVGIYMQIDSDFNMLTGTFDSSWETKDCPGKTTGTNAKTKLADFGYTIEDMYTSYNTAHNLASGATGYKSNGPRGIRVGTSNSWNITLNTSNELNKSSGNNYIAIKFYAVDEDGNISVWNDEDLVIVCVDSDAPKIGSSEPLYLHQYGFKKTDTGAIYYAKSSSPAAGEQLYTTPGCTTAATDITYASANFTSSISTIEYKKDMWLNGEWWLTGSVEDESGIAEIKIGGMGGNSIKAQCTPVAAGTWANGTSGYRLNYLIGSTDTTNPGYGVLSYSLWVQDDTQEGTKKDTTLAISVQYDNKNPTLAATTDSDYLISENVVNENGFYKVQSVVTEASGESGFDKVIFYFKRGTTVYDSYMPKAVAAKNALATSALVSDSDIYWKSNTVTAINGAVITVSADDNIHKGGLVKLGGVIYTITNVNGTSVTLSGNPPSLATGSTMPAYFAIGHVVDHAGTESEGTSKIAATQTNPNPYGLGYYGNSPDDDGDLMLEKVSTGTTKTLWYGLINSRNIPDGAIEIHYVAFDKAGNMAHGQVTNAFVKNNGPRLASLRAWTDYNGNEAGFEDSTDLTSAAHKEYESENDVKYYTRRDRKIGGKTVSRATAVTENLIVTGNDKGIEEGATAFMRVTDQTKFYPEIVGGNGNLYYSYKIGEGTDPSGWTITGNGGTTAFSTRERVEYSDVSADYTTTDEQGESYVNGSALDEITADTTLLGNVGNGNKWFEYTIWDSTGGDKPEWAGGSAGITTLSAKFTVLLNVAYADTSAPKAVISPFFWKSKSENSLYGNSKDNGHIELENDLTGTVAATLYGTDPKVSGKITIRGTAYDDIRLKELWVKFDDIAALTGTASQTATSGYVKAATYTKSTATWTPATATMAGNGWEFTATNVYCNKDGHLVNWELSINTANVKNGNTVAAAAINKKAYVMALDDRGSLYSSTTASGTAPANGDYSNAAVTYNNPFYQMDIVPYITAIKTTNRTNSGLKDNNIRSASGKYSVIKGTTADFITVEGFNLNVSDARIVTEARRSALTTAWTDADITLTPTSKATDFTSFKGRNNLSKSGYLEVLVNGVRAMNNINNDNAYGTAKNESGVQLTSANAAVTDFENAYNREPDYYTTKNVQLTDNRYIRVFDMRDTGVENGYYPVMLMNGNNPVFGYVDNNGGPATNVGTEAGTGAGSDYSSNAHAQRAEFSGTELTNGKAKEIYTEYLVKQLATEQMGMAVDEGGRYYNVTLFNYDGGALGLYYNRYQELSPSRSGDCWGPGTGYSNYTGKYAYNFNNNAIVLETTNYNNALKLNRYEYPKIITSGNSTTGNAIIYMTYFDSKTGDLLFRNFIIGKDVTALTETPSYTFNYQGRLQTGGNMFNPTYTYYYSGPNNNNGKYVKVGNTFYQLTYDDTYGLYSTSYNGQDTITSPLYNSNNNDSVITYDTSLDTSYEQKVNFIENYQNSSAYDIGRLSVVTTGSKYFDMGVTNDNHVVIAYVDSSTNKLVLKYSTNAVTGANPTTEVAWTTSSVAFPENIGTDVSIAVDGKAVHIAAFDSFDSNLVYMYLPNYNSAEGYKEVTVDQASAVGNWTQIKVKDGVPYIAYYNSTENGGRDGIKLAYPVAANGKTAVQNKENPGVDVKPGTAYASSGTGAATGYTTGAWEYMTVPAITPPQGGDPKFQQVCLDFDSDGRPVVGYLGTNLEFGKALDE